MSDFSGREPLEFVLDLTLAERKVWLTRRVEVYRSAVLQYAATLVRERGAKKTVAEAEAEAVIETDGLTKAIALEAPLYPFLLGGDVTTLEDLNG